MLNRGMMTSDSGLWGTPTDFYEWLNKQFAFTVDVCALPTNAKHRRFWTPKDNGLAQSWEGETAFCNPEYGRGIGAWLDKGRESAIEERAVAAFLIPSRVDTDWWWTYVMSADGAAGKLRSSYYHEASRVLWLRWEGLTTGIYHHDKRIEFDGMQEGDGAPFPSSVVIHASPSRRPLATRPRLEPGQRWLVEGWP